jgi:hypothetical protein
MGRGGKNIVQSGCRMAARQRETAERLRRCLALYNVLAWRILYATMLARAVPNNGLPQHGQAPFRTTQVEAIWTFQVADVQAFSHSQHTHSAPSTSTPTGRGVSAG